MNPQDFGIPFVDRLAERGDAPAVVTDTGSRLSYRELAGRVRDRADELGDGRRLVLVATENRLDSLVTYLAALQARHPVVLAPPRSHTLTRLVDEFDPDVIVNGDRVRHRRPTGRHDLHPDLALLLCTSGSTGCPKLVRLGAEGLAANADAIADYLGIRPGDRAAATLPLHYCYGLSVVNSNLHRGAALLLSERSVTDPAFWTWFRAEQGTSLHGVPYTFELLDEVGFPDLELPALRYVTQAGGRLDPDRVRRYVELGRRRGWRFIVMYGQTEATARMAYLPPERAAAAPEAIGVPIPGGSFRIDHGDDAASPDEGELVYSGPNVMLGYAERPAELALGRVVTELHTGDLGRRRPDGLYEVIGRRHRIIKPFGLRIDLEHLDRLLAQEGTPAACTGDDTGLVVAIEGSKADRPDPDAVHALVCGRTGLPTSRVRVVTLPVLPRTPSGKLDHTALRRLCAERHRGRRWRRPRPPRPPRPRTVREVFRRVFPLPALPDEATFVGLGGDSLSFVRMSTELHRLLGAVPPGWPDMTIAELTAIRASSTRWVRVETTVLLRAVAIVLVVGAHVGAFVMLGGAHLLMAVSGWVTARFVLSSSARRPSGPLVRAATRIAVPSALWIAWRSWLEHDVQWRNALLLNRWLAPDTWGYWFVESLCQILLLLAALFAVPPVRRAYRRRPFECTLALFAVALLPRVYRDPGNAFDGRLMSTHLVLWLFVLGWLAHQATSPSRRVAVGLLTCLLVPPFFVEPSRMIVVTGGLLVMLYLPSMPIPRPVLRPIGAVAGASLTIYLTHYALFPDLERWLPDGVVVPICVLAGVLAHKVVTAAAHRAARLSARHRRPGSSRRLTPRTHRAPILRAWSFSAKATSRCGRPCCAVTGQAPAALLEPGTRRSTSDRGPVRRR